MQETAARNFQISHFMMIEMPLNYEKYSNVHKNFIQKFRKIFEDLSSSQKIPTRSNFIPKKSQKNVCVQVEIDRNQDRNRNFDKKRISYLLG